MQNKVENKIILSIILPVYNEAHFISEVIRSIIKSASDFLDLIEIIIVNNQSTDNTITIAKNILKKEAIQYSFINNDKNNTSAGFNAGIKEANGKYIMIMGGHTLLNKTYIKILLNKLKNEIQYDCIGGKHEIIADNFNQEIIKTILTSGFGVGNSKFRTSNVGGYTDTVPYGTYRKNVFEKFGLFDESYIRNQDLEYNLRLNTGGGKVYFEPSLITYYRLTKKYSITNFLKKYFHNGKWIGAKIFKNDSWSWRHTMPLFFLLSIIFCTSAQFFSKTFSVMLVSIILSHLTIGYYFSLVHVKKIKLGLVMPVFYFIFHLTYGFGTLYGIVNND